MTPGGLYLAIVALSLPLAAWLFVGGAALRAAGDTRTPMLAMLAVNIINIAVAFVCIYGLGPMPRLGVAGSAIGAAVGRASGGVILTFVLWRGRYGLRLRPGQALPDWMQIKRILNIGLPAGAEQFLMRMAQTAFVMVVAGLGTQALAAHTVAQQSESLSYMPGFGFAVAATTLTGNGLGAGDLQHARSDARLAERMAVVVMVGMGVFFFTFAAPLIGLFVSDPEVVRLGVGPLRLEALLQPALATLLVGRFGLMGAWIAMGLDLNLRGFAMWLRFRGEHWTQSVFRHPEQFANDHGQLV